MVWINCQGFLTEIQIDSLLFLGTIIFSAQKVRLTTTPRMWLRSLNSRRRIIRKFYRDFFSHEPSSEASDRTALRSTGRGLYLKSVAWASRSLEAGRNSLAAMGRIEENTYQTLANELKWGDEQKGWLFDCLRYIMILSYWKRTRAERLFVPNRKERSFELGSLSFV